MKSNINRKLYKEDKFCRRYGCQHHRLTVLRNDKKAERKQWRKFMKVMESEQND